MSKYSSFPIWLFFAIPFAVGGAAALCAGILHLYRAHESSSWPTVIGAVTSSRVKIIENEGPTYRPSVLYEYEVSGESYSSNRVFYGSFVGLGNPRKARRTVKKYPTGADVVVHYKPNDPKTSVLETGVHAENLFLPAFGTAFILAALFVLKVFPFIFSTPAEQEHDTDS